MSTPAILTPDGHALGWRPSLEDPARVNWARRLSLHVAFNSVYAADDRPLPGAYTAAYMILWYYNQGQVGSCFSNGLCSADEMGTSAAVLAGQKAADGSDFEEVQLSRAMIWHEGRKLDGLLGSRGDGGSITNAMRAAYEIGVCREPTWPYKPDHDWLERTPTADAYAEAKRNRLTGIIADLSYAESDVDRWRRLIFNGSFPVIGIWWPYGWDQGQIDQYGRTKGIGPGVYGHALEVIGWVEPGVWDDSRWWHIRNSHGPIYPLPSPEMRAKVLGFASARPDRCYNFWARDDLLRKVSGYEYSEVQAAAGVAGFQIRRNLPWERAAC